MKTFIPAEEIPASNTSSRDLRMRPRLPFIGIPSAMAKSFTRCGVIGILLASPALCHGYIDAGLRSSSSLDIELIDRIMAVLQAQPQRSGTLSVATSLQQPEQAMLAASAPSKPDSPNAGSDDARSEKTSAGFTVTEHAERLPDMDRKLAARSTDVKVSLATIPAMPERAGAEVQADGRPRVRESAPRVQAPSAYRYLVFYSGDDLDQQHPSAREQAHARKDGAMETSERDRPLEKKTGQSLIPASFSPFADNAKNDRNQNDIRNTILEWAKAWSSKRIDSYLDFYSKDFRPADRISARQWENVRRRRIEGKSWIDVRIDTPRFVIAGDVAVAYFLQHYASDRLRSSVMKSLRLVRDDGKWRIVEEQVLAAKNRNTISDN